MSGPRGISVPFALNHMVAPQLSLDRFMALAREAGVSAIEIRNDIAGNAILDGTGPVEVRRLANEAGLTILSINALQRFNDWGPVRADEARTLADYAAECGARALVLVPTNDGTVLAQPERSARLAETLGALQPILAERAILGLVEPLGFVTSGLRFKAEAAAAITALGDGAPFKLVHDSFHHHLAGVPDLFPALTGLVHVSGVETPGLAVSDMRDGDRVLVGPGDRIDNLGQLARLCDAGYQGPVSFEPFAGQLADPVAGARAIAQSIAFIRTGFASEVSARQRA